MDPRNEELAKKLVNYSCEIKPGEKVLIEANGLEGLSLVNEIIKEVYKAGGMPFVNIMNESITRQLYLNATQEQLKSMAKYDLVRMSEMQAYIGVRGNTNLNELSDVSQETLSMVSQYYSRPVNEVRVPKTKWVVLRYPSASMAQASSTSIEAYETFYYNVCNLDYAKMSKAMDNLVDLLNKTDKVRITGPGTDIEFSIKDIPSVKCDGKRNIPDGEVYTAPIKNSVNGCITYNAPAEYLGFTYENIKFTFKDGKIIEATSNDTKRINKVLDIDEGARYIGEFAIGVNPYITHPVKNTLFDEKIKGSIHFTPGNAYTEADNGNVSAVHWDLVLIQTKEYGGGKIYFDDVLVREDGIFVIPELLCLNPENLC